MVQKNHTISIIVMGQSLDLDGTDSLNLRLNTVLFDPATAKNRTGEYSYSFKLPITPRNARLFDYANVPSKTNKFSKVWKCEVYSDGYLVFEGDLVLYSVEEKHFNVNLIQKKVDTLDEIFGEDTMNQLTWNVDYNGIDTINQINGSISQNHDVIYPLVSYGPFIKKPYKTYSNEYNEFTSKFLLDKYVCWYDSSMPPSPRLVTLVKKLFERKKYSVVGDILNTTSPIYDVYLSQNLADGQVPRYNLGNENVGHLNLSFNFKNRDRFYQGGSDYKTFSIVPITQDLLYGYKKIAGTELYDFDRVNVYDIFDAINTYKGYTYPGGGAVPEGIEGMSVTVNKGAHGSMWQGNCIVIPNDGVYKIEMEVTMSLRPSIVGTTHGEYYLKWNSSSGDWDTLAELGRNFQDCPLEVQLVRNSDSVELIHGYSSESYQETTIYPHEAPPTDPNPGAQTRGSSSGIATSGDNVGRRPSQTEGVVSGSSPSDVEETNPYYYGYMPRKGELVAYDPWVNDNFICGGTSISDSVSVLKNGYSWNSGMTQKNYSRYQCDGYYGVNRSKTWTRTSFNENTYPGAPANSVVTNTETTTGGTSYQMSKTVKVSCAVMLNAGDILILKAVARAYPSANGFGGVAREEPWYAFQMNGKIDIQAYSPSAGDLMSTDFRYDSPTKFDTQLNIGQFLNRNTKQKDFIENFCNALNLSANVDQANKTVTLKSNKIDFESFSTAIDLDDRVNSSNFVMEHINYPKTLEVKYNIDDEEYGFYESVVAAGDNHINEDDWKDWAFTGSEPVTLSTYPDAEPEDIKLDNSYTWYGEFRTPDDKTISIPVIAKDENMIENYKYEETMLTDGFGQPQRWWFKGTTRNDITFTTTNGLNFHPHIVENRKSSLVLDYTTDPNSLLNKFFNVNPYLSSDLITVEVYLSAEEYTMIKLGCPIRVNNDIYLVCEITGYDPTGNNKTKIKAMKKS